MADPVTWHGLAVYGTTRDEMEQMARDMANLTMLEWTRKRYPAPPENAKENSAELLLRVGEDEERLTYDEFAERFAA